MATVILTIEPTSASVPERVVSLRTWLNGSWGALFSHPDDFAPAPTTPSGFVTCIAERILDAGIKPIAFTHSLDALPSSWLDHAFNDDALIALNQGDARVVDLAEHVLMSTLGSLVNQRFVLIVDERARVRTTLRYQAFDRPRTMNDIVELAGVLKVGKKQRAARALAV